MLGIIAASTLWIMGAIFITALLLDIFNKHKKDKLLWKYPYQLYIFGVFWPISILILLGFFVFKMPRR